ncbi:MAG TPA: cytochrome c, partial [Acidobacteriaceae bacterium]
TRLQRARRHMLKPALSLLLLLLTLPLGQQPTPDQPAAVAPIPAADAARVNPIKPTAASLARARKVYGYDCAMCHGPTGNGKGEIAGMTLKDYTDPAALRDRTDGELFYIIQNGRGQMPGESGRQTAEEAWNMVILVRSFSHK